MENMMVALSKLSEKERNLLLTKAWFINHRPMSIAELAVTPKDRVATVIDIFSRGEDNKDKALRKIYYKIIEK